MLNEILVTFVVCIDTYLMSLNYNSSGIKIPFSTGLVMSSISALILYLSLLISEVLGIIIPVRIFSAIGFIVLTAMGTVTIFKSMVRRVIHKLSERGDICIRMSRLGVGVRLYLDERTADFDYSKVLSISESITLAIALSMDAVAVGINSSFLGLNPLRTALMTLFVGIASIYLGNIMGKKISALKHDFSWLGGVMLILVAIMGII